MRLTNTMRDSVVRKEVDAKYSEKLKKAEDKLRKEVEKEIIKLFPCPIPEKYINEGWINTANTVSVKFDKNRSSESIHLNSSFPCKPHRYSFEIVSPSEKLQELKAEVDSIKNEKSIFYSKLKKIMYGFTTVKQVLQHIPELDQYFNPPKKAESLVPVPIAQINEVRKLLAR